jgi:hypothetical protein
MTKNCYHSFLISTPSYKILIINFNTDFQLKKVLKVTLKLKWLMKFKKISWWIKSNGLWHDL